MAAIIELKYFNTFVLKKIKSVCAVVPGNEASTLSIIDSTAKKLTINTSLLETEMNTGQQIKIIYQILGIDVTYVSYITQRLNGTEFTVAEVPPAGAIGSTVILGKLVNFDNIELNYAGDDESDWLLEESRIRRIKPIK